MSKELLDVLEPVLGNELAKDIIAHRKGLKCPLTPRGAVALLKQYQLTGSPVEAAEEHLNRGWQGFKAEWIKPKANFRDERNPMPARTSANYGNSAPVSAPEPLSAEERSRRAEMVAKSRNLLRGALQ